MLRYRPAGPLLEIKLLSGKLEEVYLPHSLCLGGSDPAVLGDAVRALHGNDSSVSLEMCELSRFHARLLVKQFSLREIVWNMGIPVKTHCDVLIHEYCPQPLVLNTFLLPSPSSVKEAVQKSLGGSAIVKSPPNKSLWIDSTVKLSASPETEITPSEVLISYRNPPTFFEMCLKNPSQDYKMKMKTPEDCTVWEAVLRQGADYHRTQQCADTPHIPGSHTELQSWQVTARTPMSDVTEEQLMKLAKLMGGEWKQVGIGYLGVSKQELDKIQASEDDSTMQRFCMLDLWRMKNKGKAGLRELRNCLDEDDVPNTVRDCLEEMLMNNSELLTEADPAFRSIGPNSKDQSCFG
ncbi:NACHT, LRR and PYD domains-containing protein 1 homolog [Engraulis encrasicolus]|uniref:NACHT, LRR and PYD domains-containing protein 1 homolog n=1 Tax=Engraulis encrasicolus TaxID=184585 RepID=UPI002FD1423D